MILALHDGELIPGVIKESCILALASREIVLKIDIKCAEYNYWTFCYICFLSPFHFQLVT